MGCLFAMFSGLFPRLALFVLWIARPALVGAAFNTFLIPLLGIIFLPFATLIYVLFYTPGIGLTGWEWLWVILAGLLDIGHWGASYTQRNQIPGVQGRWTQSNRAGRYPAANLPGGQSSCNARSLSLHSR